MPIVEVRVTPTVEIAFTQGVFIDANTNAHRKYVNAITIDAVIGEEAHSGMDPDSLTVGLPIVADSATAPPVALGHITIPLFDVFYACGVALVVFVVPVRKDDSGCNCDKTGCNCDKTGVSPEVTSIR